MIGHNLFGKTRHYPLGAISALGLALCCSGICNLAGAAPRLKVSDNHRFLVYENGRPFFYLGDTAWELFHRLNREEAERYLQDRAKKNFTVIQAVAVAPMDGLRAPNAYGQLPLKNNDPLLAPS